MDSSERKSLEIPLSRDTILIYFPQQGYITAAQKIQRKKILEKNEKEVEKAYSKS